MPYKPGFVRLTHAIRASHLSSRTVAGTVVRVPMDRTLWREPTDILRKRPPCSGQGLPFDIVTDANCGLLPPLVSPLRYVKT